MADHGGHGGHGGGHEKGHGDHGGHGKEKKGGMSRRDFLQNFAMLFGIPQFIGIASVPTNRDGVKDFLDTFPGMKFASFWKPGGGGGGGGHGGGGGGHGGHGGH